MSKALCSTCFTPAEISQLEAGGIDLQKLWALIQAMGPKIVPLVQLWLHTLPQTGWVPIVEALIDALFTPTPTVTA